MEANRDELAVLLGRLYELRSCSPMLHSWFGVLDRHAIEVPTDLDQPEHALENAGRAVAPFVLTPEALADLSRELQMVEEVRLTLGKTELMVFHMVSRLGGLLRGGQQSESSVVPIRRSDEERRIFDFDTRELDYFSTAVLVRSRASDFGQPIDELERRHVEAGFMLAKHYSAEQGTSYVVEAIAKAKVQIYGQNLRWLVQLHGLSWLDGFGSRHQSCCKLSCYGLVASLTSKLTEQ